MPPDSGSSEKETRNSFALVSGRYIDSLLEKFSTPRNEKRNRRILLLLTAFFLTLLIIPNQEFLAVTYKAGDIATSDIRATQDYLLEDRPLTDKKQAEAEAATPYVYSYNRSSLNEIVQRFEAALAVISEARNVDDVSAVKRMPERLGEAFGFEVSPEEIAALGRVKSDLVLIEEVRRLLAPFASRKIIADRKSFLADSSHGIVLVDSSTGQVIGGGDSSTSFIEIAEARAQLGRARIAGGIGNRDLGSIKGLIIKSLRPNLSYNREMTEQRKLKAREAIRPVLFQIKRGEMIVRVGERIREDQAQKLTMIFEARHGINKLFMGIGLFGLVLTLFHFPYRFARKNIRKFNPTIKDLLFLSLLTSGVFFGLKMALAISAGLGGPFPTIDTHDYFYLLPFAVGPMLVRIVLNSEVSLVFTAITAPLIGLMFNNSLFIVVYALLAGIVGAHGVRHCKDRGTIYTAGMKISVVNLALALSFQIFNDSLLSVQTLYCGMFAVAGGFINAAIVTSLIPLVETLFRYTTDIKLLERANLNSPILRELMIQAPGTYHHSVLVGNLVESAAEAINANPLLARVAAYYHDIGKIRKPLYFIENMKGGENRHDKLSPSMSALILTSHVKEGVELAKEHRLGAPIIDIIRQSHGTALITFFYQKAKTLAGADGSAVKEQDFRYPGPKPQTREAGLVMLADCVEAASRTLTDPTPARIQGMVQKIINNIFIDGQMDECELTLKNLHEIAKSFNRVLVGIYHQRIDYPEPVYKEKTSGGKKPIEGVDSEQTEEASGKGPESQKGGGEDIKRLGISR